MTDRRAYKAAYYQAHKAKTAKYNAKYYRAHKEEEAKHNAVYYQEHRAERATYLEENRDKIARRTAKYRKTNKAQIAQRGAEYNQAHRVEKAKYNAEYRESHKAERAVYEARRRALIRGTIDNATREQLAEIAEIYRKACEDPKIRCYICGELIPMGERQVDHIFPASKGGSSLPSNLAVVHAKCNREKYNKLPEEIGLLI